MESKEENLGHSNFISHDSTASPLTKKANDEQNSLELSTLSRRSVTEISEQPQIKHWYNKKKTFRFIVACNIFSGSEATFPEVNQHIFARDGNIYHVNIEKVSESSENFTLSLKMKVETGSVFGSRKFDFDCEVKATADPLHTQSINETFDENNESTSDICIPMIQRLQRIAINISISQSKSNILTDDYAGIINVGTVCYMASYLQSLNICGFFKKALFKLPTNPEEKVVFGMQKIFFDLLTSKQPVNPRVLISSFDWNFEQINEQQDASEFNMIISDILEKKMKGTEVEGAYEKAFEGKLVNIITCSDVDFESRREEKFGFLTLNIENCQTLYDSLDKFTQAEVLEGSNAYDAGEHGKQVAIKSMKLLETPNVLNIQLLRISFNEYGESFKINSELQFFPEIDLYNYVSEPGENKGQHTYTLHGVIVHRGRVDSGHYYCYIRPTLEDKWYLFNDDLVALSDKSDVFDLNFGCEYNPFKIDDDLNLVPFKKQSFDESAYILIYYKNSTRTEMLSPLTEHDISPDSRNYFEEIKFREQIDEYSKRIKRENIEVKFVHYSLLTNHNDPGILPSMASSEEGVSVVDDSNSISYCFPYFYTFGDIKENLADKMKLTDRNLKLFLWCKSSESNFYDNRFCGKWIDTSTLSETSIIKLRNSLNVEYLVVYVHVESATIACSIVNRLSVINCFEVIPNNRLIYENITNRFKFTSFDNSISEIPEGKLVFLKQITSSGKIAIKSKMYEGNIFSSICQEIEEIHKSSYKIFADMSVIDDEFDYKNVLQEVTSNQFFEDNTNLSVFVLIVDLDGTIASVESHYRKRISVGTFLINFETNFLGLSSQLHIEFSINGTLSELKAKTVEKIKEAFKKEGYQPGYDTFILKISEATTFQSLDEFIDNLNGDFISFACFDDTTSDLMNDTQLARDFLDLHEMEARAYLLLNPINVTNDFQTIRINRIHKREMSQVFFINLYKKKSMLVDELLDLLLNHVFSGQKEKHTVLNSILYMTTVNSNFYSSIQLPGKRSFTAEVLSKRESIMELLPEEVIEDMKNEQNTLLQVSVRSDLYNPPGLPYILSIRKNWNFEDFVEKLKEALEKQGEENSQLIQLIEKKKFEVSEVTDEFEYLNGRQMLNKSSDFSKVKKVSVVFNTSERGKLTIQV